VFHQALHAGTISQPLFIYLSFEIAIFCNALRLKKCVTNRRQTTMIAITYISRSSHVMGKVARRPRYLIAGIVCVQVLERGSAYPPVPRLSVLWLS